MCRFLSYRGRSTTMEELLFNASHSLVEQSKHAELRFEATNGDGFGLGWYPQDDDPVPGTFVSIEPAWSNRNLEQLSKKIHTNQFFAHVRDASIGMPVSQANCHPFQKGEYLWMHNGFLGDFNLTRRCLLAKLSDRAFQYIDGNTDSEHIFALFLDQIQFKSQCTTQELETAVLNTLEQIIELRDQSGVNSKADMNFALSNGSNQVFTRFTYKSNEAAPSLYYQQTESSIIVASEPLTEDNNWVQVENNQMLIINQQNSLSLKMIHL